MKSSITSAHLIMLEKKYGGYVTNVKRNKRSKLDPRSKIELSQGGMTGGDRMSSQYHDYAKYYSKYINSFLNKGSPKVIVEIGILTGIGLAIWCDLFPNARVIGLDIDLDHFNNNRDNLSNLGAFKKNSPEVYVFDQFYPNHVLIQSILNSDTLDIVIDDGFHSSESIITTLKSLYQSFSNHFLYFIEDNANVASILKEYLPYNISSHGELTVLQNKV
tara:strand:- start:767 stop:1420 length:654 start_codon:yes stop_codon:yes gene_type:complete